MFSSEWNRGLSALLLMPSLEPSDSKCCWRLPTAVQREGGSGPGALWTCSSGGFASFAKKREVSSGRGAACAAGRPRSLRQSLPAKQLLCHCQGWSEEQKAQQPLGCDGLGTSQLPSLCAHPGSRERRTEWCPEPTWHWCMRCTQSSVFVLALFGGGEAAAVGGIALPSGRSFCSPERAVAPVRGGKEVWQCPSWGRPGLALGATRLARPQTVWYQRCGSLSAAGSLPWLSREELCLSLPLLAGWSLRSHQRAPEVPERALGWDGAAVPARPAPWADGWSGLVSASRLAARGWAAAGTAASTGGSPTGLAAKSFCSLRTERVVGFCTRRGGLSWVDRGRPGVCSQHSFRHLLPTFTPRCSGCRECWGTGKRRANLKCALRSSRERCQGSLVCGAWEAALRWAGFCLQPRGLSCAWGARRGTADYMQRRYLAVSEMCSSGQRCVWTVELVYCVISCHPIPGRFLVQEMTGVWDHHRQRCALTQA